MLNRHFRLWPWAGLLLVLAHWMPRWSHLRPLAVAPATAAAPPAPNPPATYVFYSIIHSVEQHILERDSAASVPYVLLAVPK